MARKHFSAKLLSSSIVVVLTLAACVMTPDAPTYGISGAVRGATGEGESGVTVLLRGAAQASTVTDADGKYAFSGLPAGNYTVTPAAGGYTYSPASADVTLGAASQVVPDFTARFTARIWAVGGTGVAITVLGWNGHAWSEVASGPPGVLNGIWGTSADDAWAVGLEVAGPSYDGIILHWNGSAWSTTSAGSAGTSLYRGWSASPDDVWSIGVDGTGGFILRRQAGSWLRVSSGWWPNAAWGSSATDIWAVGYQMVQHWDGTLWTAVPTATASDLIAVHGLTADDVWAVGSGGAALHWDGRTWSSVETGTNATLRGVWGRAADDVWAVGTCSLTPGTIRDCDPQSGNEALIVHWDGRAWRRVASGTRSWLNAVWGRSANDVWAVGVGGTILHWDGAAWTATPSGSRSADLRGVWGAERR